MTDAAIEEGHRKRKKAGLLRWRILAALGLLGLGGCFLWWRNGGRELVFFALQPGFQVIKIDNPARTMLVMRMNETYLVNCGQTCALFSVGKTYHMRDEGGRLRFLKRGQRIELPILQEHIEFETAPGGHG